MSGFITGFVFRAGHSEKHYLMNESGRKYSTTFTRDAAKALHFSTEEEARAVMERKLDAAGRGVADGYFYLSFVESVD